MSKLTESAKGEDCTLRIFPYCNQNPETTVLCHINSPDKGIGIKSPDWFGVFACSACHDIIDRRAYTTITEAEIDKQIIRALHLTLKRQIEKELISYER